DKTVDVNNVSVSLPPLRLCAALHCDLVPVCEVIRCPFVVPSFRTRNCLYSGGSSAVCRSGSARRREVGRGSGAGGEGAAGAEVSRRSAPASRRSRHARLAQFSRADAQRDLDGEAPAQAIRQDGTCHCVGGGEGRRVLLTG